MNNQKLFFIIFLSFLYIACSFSRDEIEYKKNINELKKLLIQLEKVTRQEKDIILPDGRKATMIDIQGEMDFINKTKNKWLNMGNQLKEISQIYPQSKWADDALYCAALLYLTMDVNKYPTEYTKKSIEIFKLFIDKYPEARLEQWTENNFKKVVWGKYDIFIKTLLPDTVTEKEKLQLLFSYFLAIQLAKDNNYSEAIKIFNQVKDRYPGSEYNRMFIEQINMWRDIINNSEE